MEIENFLKKIKQNLKKYKNFQFIDEAFSVFTYKQGSVYKFVYYLTSTAIFMLVFILAFIVFALFNCFGAVNSLNQVNFITFFFYFVSICVVSFLISPFLHGYYLMIFKDVYLNLKSDLADFFFFIHSFDDNKKNYLIKGYFITVGVTFLISLAIMVSIGLIGILKNYIPHTFILGTILILLLKIMVIVVVFSLIFPLVLIWIIGFIKANNNFENKVENEGIDFIIILKGLVNIFSLSLKVYFREFFNLFIIGLFMSLGFISVIGSLLTLPLGSIMVAIVLRKYY